MRNALPYGSQLGDLIGRYEPSTEAHETLSSFVDGHRKRGMVFCISANCVTTKTLITPCQQRGAGGIVGLTEMLSFAKSVG